MSASNSFNRATACRSTIISSKDARTWDLRKERDSSRANLSWSGALALIVGNDCATFSYLPKAVRTREGRFGAVRASLDCFFEGSGEDCAEGGGAFAFLCRGGGRCWSCEGAC